MASESPSNFPPPAERKGVLAFVQGLKEPAPQQLPETSPAPSSLIKPATKAGAPYRHFAEYSWSTQQNFWLKVSLIVHVTIVLLVWFGGFLCFNRPTYIQIGNTTLSEAARNFYSINYTEVDPAKTFDLMAYFTISALQQLHQVDVSGNPYQSLLQGMVHPTLLKKASDRYTRNIPAIRKQKLIQNLLIQRIRPPISNPENNTLAIFLDGYFAIMGAKEDGGPLNRITPYRAKVLLRMQPSSTLNPYPFYIEELDEVFGDAEVKKWDEANKKFFK